jgi:hypothetical protein
LISVCYVEGMHMFDTGKSANPRGRPKGAYGGRIQALALLDRLMARNKNKKLLEKAMQDLFVKDPMGFFKTVVMPLLPKESKVAMEHGVIEWRSLLEAGAPRAGESGERSEV